MLGSNDGLLQLTSSRSLRADGSRADLYVSLGRDNRVAVLNRTPDGAAALMALRILYLPRARDR